MNTYESVSNSFSPRSISKAAIVFGIAIVAVWLLFPTLLPTISSAVTASPNRDAYTSSAQPNTNFGTAATLRISAVERTWVRFNLSPIIPPGTTGSEIVQATVTLWADTVTTAGLFDVHRIIGAWAQGTLTDSAPPPIGPLEASGVSVTGRSFVTFDITPLVREWVNGFPNEGIALVPSIGSSINVRFDSREDTGTSHEPRLQITLNTGGGAGGVPTGAMILWDGAGCPTGFSRVTIYDGRFLVASSTPGLLGGSNTHTHGAGSYTGAGHTHSLSDVSRGIGWNASNNPNNPPGETVAVVVNDFQSAIAQPSGDGAIGGTSGPSDSRPEFVTICLCRKD